MNYIKFLIGGAAATALALSVASCGDSNEEPQGGKTDTKAEWTDSEKENSQKITTEEEAKEYIGQTASLVLDKFRPADQRPILELAANFVDAYGDYTIDLGGSQYGAPRCGSKALGRLFKGFRDAAASREYLGYAASAQNVLELGMFTGVYEPDTRRGVFYRAGDSSDIIIRFQSNGKRCELKVVPGKAAWTLDAAELSEGEIDAVKIPREMTFSLTEGSTTLVNGSLATYWADGSELSFATDVTALNVRAAADTKATNSVVKSTEKLFVDGTEIVSASATVNGKGMVTSSTIEKAFDREEDTYETWTGNGYETVTEYYYEANPRKFANIFQNGSAYAKLLGRVMVKAAVPDSHKLLELDETCFNSYDYDSQSEAKKDCQAACSLLNSGVPAKLYIAGNDAATATLKWQPYLNEEDYGYGYSYWCWEPEGVMEFADGTRYSFYDYDVNDFAGLLNRFDNVFQSYENLFNALF